MTLSREWNSSEYHRLSAPQVGWGQKVLSRLALRGDETVLDAGCGTGRLTADLLRALPRGRVVALDLSQNMVRTARQQLAPEFGARVGFVAGEVQSLPFHDAFDGVFSTATFHWILDHGQLFRSLHQALRRGGWLHAQCGGGPNLARLRARVKALASTSKFAPFLGDYAEPWFFSNPENAARQLEQAGFMEIQTSLEPALTLLDDEQHYRDFVQTAILHRHLARLPEKRLQQELLEELAAQAATDDPPYSLDYWRLNLSARVT